MVAMLFVDVRGEADEMAMVVVVVRDGCRVSW